MSSSNDRGPGVKVPPPLIFITVSLLCYLLERLYPLPLLTEELSLLKTGSYALVAFGLSVIFMSVFSFLRHKTHIEPWKPVSALLTSGVFAYSRNPIYLGFILLVCGAAMYLNTLWLLLGLLPSIWLLLILVIYKEELYLEQKFGGAYLDYKKRVRRWL